MGDIAPFLVPITLFITLGAVLIFRGPLGKALGERIAGGDRHGELGPELDAMRQGLEEVRERLLDLEERVDFTERVLTREKDAGRLPPAE